MAVAELFLTECVKSALKIVEGIAEGFTKRTNKLRKHAYLIVKGLTLLDEDISKLQDLIGEAQRSNDEHFLERWETNVSRTDRARPVECPRLEAILNDITDTLEALEYATDMISMRYSVYKNFHDIRMMKQFIWTERFLLKALRHSSIRSQSDGLPCEVNLSPEGMQDALTKIKTVCVELRAKIAEFIRENYKITDLPSGR